MASSPRSNIMSAPQGPRGSGGRGRTARGRGTAAPRSSTNQFRAKSAARWTGSSDATSSATTETTSKDKLATRQQAHRTDWPKPSPHTTSQPRGKKSGQAPRASMSSPHGGIAQAPGMGATTLPVQQKMDDVYQEVCNAGLQLLTR